MLTTFLRGRMAFAIKAVILALSSSLLLMLAQSAFAQGQYAIALFLFLAVVLLILTYLSRSRSSVPLKFFVPGMLLLFAFVLTPVLYTLVMSSYNYKTGNTISKEQAIERIKALALETDAAGTAFDVVVGDYQGEPAILVSDTYIQNYFLATKSERIPLSATELEIDENGVAQSATDFTAIAAEKVSGSEAAKVRFKYENEYFILLESLEVGVVYRQTLEYDADNDRFKSLISDSIYADNGDGNYVNLSDSSDRLEPGWRNPNWLANYSRLLTDQKVRDPLISVFIWNVSFASITVLTQFAFGLLLALALNKAIRGRRIYRSILVLPYAMPSIMSILIWGGMFNTEFGAINELLGEQVAWFQDPGFARIAVIVVNLWLGFPYFYLVSSGSLQAIPGELLEAAAIDGANPRQIFRKVTLPLLLQILTPLLIASFAFNFNNFNLIYLLTGGGPRNELDGELAGATDILISYTYQIAFGSSIQDLGLASAISVIIFFIVASISIYGVRRSKVLDSFS